MSALEEDLQLAASGYLDRDGLRERYPDVDVDSVLDLHNGLALLAEVEPAVPDWRDVAQLLAAEPGANRWNRRVRRTLGAAGVALILVPVAADAIEAVAPDAVRDTVIDRITDFLPWDSDSPVTDRAPTDGPIIDEPINDEAPATDRPIDEVPVDGPVDDAVPDDGQVDVLPTDGAVTDNSDPTTTTPTTDGGSDAGSGASDSGATDGDSGGADQPND